MDTLPDIPILDLLAHLDWMLEFNQNSAERLRGEKDLHAFYLGRIDATETFRDFIAKWKKSE